MGYYIDATGNGALPSRGKAEALMLAGATEVEGTLEFQADLVCVVENPFFDAAAFAYSEEEMNHFINDGTTRRKTWLIVPDAAGLSRYKGPLPKFKGK